MVSLQNWNNFFLDVNALEKFSFFAFSINETEFCLKEVYRLESLMIMFYSFDKESCEGEGGGGTN